MLCMSHEILQLKLHRCKDVDHQTQLIYVNLMVLSSFVPLLYELNKEDAASSLYSYFVKLRAWANLIEKYEKIVYYSSTAPAA